MKEVRAVTGYRLLLFDDVGQAHWQEIITAKTDADALAEARAIFGVRREYSAYELSTGEQILERRDRDRPFETRAKPPWYNSQFHR